MLFLATTINYLDRIVLSVLSPVLKRELDISDQAYGNITSAFQLAYTIAFIGFGTFIDKYGTRLGYTVAIIWWSLAGMLHAFARTPIQFGIFRALLGLGEAGNFPTAIKSVTEWFPAKDRALATGIFNSGASVGAMIGPPLFVWLYQLIGWQACFVLTGAVGFVWLALWWTFYRLPAEHPRVNAAELTYIRDGEAGPVPRMPWREALKHKETWGFAAGKFFSDPVWWFYLYWLPPYLFDVRKFNLNEIGWALPVIYIMADLGSVAGGWISGFLMRRGWATGRARKFGLAANAACMPIAALAVLADSPITAVALVSLATAAHQGWSANLYTTVSDVFPKSAVATVTGIGGCVGGFGGFLFSGMIAGYIVTHYGYTPLFLTMGCFHLTGLLIIHLTMGDLKPITSPTSPVSTA